jgi:hypothetical protein
MPNNTAYFDSQASAAAALKIDIRDIREAKKAGCPAFRSGRVYKKPLLKWIARKSKKTKHKTDSGHDEVRNALCDAMSSLAELFRAGLISSDDYFDRVTKILAIRGYFS